MKNSSEKPIILNINKSKDYKLFIKLKKSKARILDFYDKLIKEYSNQTLSKKNNIRKDVWVYYPWHHTLIHLLSEKNFYYLKTCRNLNLITPSEQKKIKNALIGLAGLNVGNPTAIALTFQGFTKFKLADNDILELSNTNRFSAGLRLIDLNQNKTILTARQIYDINPFCQIKTYPQGLNENNLDDFLMKPKIDILIEEMDNLVLKVKIRELAKKYRIPVIMVTGNESDVILDIERYDLNPKLKILNGFLKENIKEKILNLQLNKLAPKDKFLLARDFIGTKFLTKRLKESFNLLMERKIPGIPQISEVSFLRATILTFISRKIILNHYVNSGRYLIKISNIRQFKI